jgi:hypothetical protein
MEFQFPPTSLTETEESAREEFIIKRLNFVNDLADAGQFVKSQWMHTAVSPVPLEIKFHILEDDPIKARAEFEARSEHLEAFHATDGCRFKAYGYRHENTTQHFAELAFGHGTVKYVVVWIENDQKEES